MMLGNINFGPILQILMLGSVTKQYFQIQQANIVKVMELVEIYIWSTKRIFKIIKVIIEDFSLINQTIILLFKVIIAVFNR